jgi:hypothetical protein
MAGRVGYISVAVMLLVLAACSGETGSSRSERPPKPASPLQVADPPPKTEEAGTSVGPDGASVVLEGARVVVPAGAVTAGRTIEVHHTAPIRRQPAELYGQPVGVEHNAPLAKPVTVRWRLPELTDVQRASLVLARWDANARAWRPEPAQPFRLDGDVLTAELTRFSFWDWIANVGQAIGEVVGARKGGPTCSDATLHPWVRDVVDPDENLSAAAIRVCFEPDRDEIVTARVVNNRTFTQQLAMSSGAQEWAWTWPGPPQHDAAGAVYDAARDVFDSKTAYLLPPVHEVAVGIGRPATPGPAVIAATGKVNPVTVLVDVVRFGLDQVNVGGTDNPLLNAFAQALYQCGGKHLLGTPNLADSAEFVRTAISVLGSCASEIRNPRSEFGQLFEDLSFAAMRTGGPVTDAVVIKANRFAYQAAGAFKALTFGKVAFYVSDQLQNAVVGPLTFSIRGDGRPQRLGDWRPTCRDIDADSNLLFRNLAFQDRFQDTTKELWQFPDWASAAQAAVRPLTHCTGTYLTELADRLPGDWDDRKAAAVVAGKIRDLAAAKDPQVVRFDGIGEFDLRVTAAELIEQGFVDQGNLYDSDRPSCVRYAKDGQGLSFSVEAGGGRVLAISNAGGDQSLHTETGGIRVGSTLAALRTVFADFQIEEHFDADFGQGTNGVIVNDQDGAIAFSLADAPAADYASGRVEISFINGVGLPGHAPTNMEDGC